MDGEPHALYGRTGVEADVACEKEDHGSSWRKRVVTLRAGEGRLKTGTCPEGASFFMKDPKDSPPECWDMSRE